MVDEVKKLNEGPSDRPQSQNGDPQDSQPDCPYSPEDLRCTGEDPWKQYEPDPVEPAKEPDEIYQTFKDELSNGPLAPVFGSGSSSGGADGECPQFTIPSSRYWPAQTVDAHCQVYDKAKPIIYIVMTWAWAFIGLYILLF